MTLSSPKRPTTDRRMAPRAALLSGLVLALGLSANDAAHATLPSSTNYAVESQVFASGGGRTTSTGYNLSGTVGQSSALGAGTSTNYAALPGFQATLDGDGDGYPNHLDAFPSDPAEWIDTDGDSIGNNADTDDDNDGMPDTWEIANGFDPLNALDAILDFDGDGFTNLEEYIAGTVPTDAVSRPIQMADFNYNFRSDILWRHGTNGRIATWLMDGFAREGTAVIGQVSLDWYITAIGDFDADGNADILWRNSVTDSVVIWQMDEFVRTGFSNIGKVSTVWKVAGLGDFDGDGMIDILWRHESSGSTAIWQMSGDTRLGTDTIGSPSLDWQIKGVADFNGEDKADILWHNNSTGSAVVWETDWDVGGYSKSATPTVGAPSPVWKIEGVADFNGGGQPDILWRNASSGSVVIWQMNGYDFDGAATIGSPSFTWQITRLGDYNGGGQADILWHRPSDSSAAIWQMVGLVREAVGTIGKPAGWTPK